MLDNHVESPLIYDAHNCELRTVSEYFRRHVGVSQVKLEVREGVYVTQGTVLGRIYWVGGRSEPLVAPEGCQGTIAWINPRFDHLSLFDRPQTLLRLNRG